MHWADAAWLAAGFAAQGLFAVRFLVQWVLSERARRSLLPVHFWYLSLIGAALLLAYAVHRRDPVIAAGQIVGVGIYFRNLHFIFPDRPVARGRRWLWLWLGLCGIAGLTGYHLGPDSASRPMMLHDFWTTFEGCVDDFWTTSEGCLDDFWTTSERCLDDFWTPFARCLDDFWTTSGRLLDDVWTTSGRLLDDFWTTC